MISVVIESRNQENALAVTLAALVQGAVEGLVAEVVIVDRGSSDGTEALADAAGCKFLRDPEIGEVVAAARGEWLLFVEPGARPLLGWVEHLHQHLAVGRRAARFSPSKEYRLPLMARLGLRPSPLRYGVLVRKREALAKTRAGRPLESLLRGVTTQKLRCEMAPAAALGL